MSQPLQAHSSGADHEGFGSAFDSLNGQRTAERGASAPDADSPPAAPGGAVRHDNGALEPSTVYRTPGSPSVSVRRWSPSLMC